MFLEIGEQPESEFVFRLRGDSQRMPQAAIFEADGGAWKVAAMDRIHQWLDRQIDGVTIIA